MRSSISHLCRSVLLSIAMCAGTHHAVAEPITYQGRLTDGSLPATGYYDMVFRIYNAPVAGDLIATAPAEVVLALDGLIIATPDFPEGTFTGETVYLDISLRHSGATLYTRLAQRQAITPAPLAIRSLNERWSPLGTTRIQTDAGINGVVINDSAPTFSDAALMVTSATGAGSLGGMYVNTPAADGYPYYGWSANRVGLAEARVDGATNTFILRSATTEWLRISTEGRVAIGTSPTATDRLRVNGNVYSTADITAANDITAGGHIASLGEVTADAYSYITSRARAISIAPEAFHPAYTTQDGTFGGSTGFACLNDAVGAGAITTGVFLPDGATVTGFDAYVVDNSAAANLSISLSRRANSAVGYTVMAEVDSTGASASIVTLTDNTIVAYEVDTSTYNYLIWVYSNDWQGIDMILKGVRIRYTVPGPD